MNGQFTIDQKTLFATLSAMQPICTKRTALEATASILFHIGTRELILKSTDLEISLQASCSISDSSIEEPFSFLVPGKRIFDLVKELEGEITCSLAHQKLSLRSGEANVGLNIKDAEQFPPFPERIENLTHLDAPFLIELLDKVSFLIPQNNANHSLNGLLVQFSPEGLTMTTTDGHCLAQIKTNKYPLAEKKQWLLPRRAVFELKKIVEHSSNTFIFLGVCGNQLVFSGESFNFFTKLLNDQFPQYQTILAKEGFEPARIDKERLMRTLRRSSCLLSGQFLATRFSFETYALQVSLENKEVGSLVEEVPLTQFAGTPLSMRFYAPYLINGLQSFEEAEIVCYLSGGTKPIIFESAKPEYHLTYLVMPVSPTTHG
ncbi:MAG: DNA polymerase III subunit beta [Candidatus Babeliales bacterium]